MQKRISLSADASQVSDFMRCPRLWYYKYIRNIEPPQIQYVKDGEVKASSISKGTMFHALLDNYYKSMPGDSVSIANNTVLRYLKENPDLDIPNKEQQAIIKRFYEYASYYRTSEFQPMVVNGVPQVEVGFTVELLNNDQYYFMLEGRIDLITDKEIFVDHKTQSRAYDYYQFSPQFLTYALASELSMGCINYISLANVINKDSFRRPCVTYSQELKAQWKEKLIKIFKRMAGCIVNNEFEMNESSCQGNFGICKYSELCETQIVHIREKLMQQHYKQREKWEPWRMTNGDE